MRRRWPGLLLISLGIAAIVWFVFGQTAHFYWVRYDDGDYVYRSGPVTSGLSWRNAGWAFTHFHASNWHPLTTMSHMLDCQLFGVRPGPMHVVNVIIHSLAAITLFFALLSLTNKMWRSAFVATVFAIHPLRVESVAWIAERKDVLSGLFFALTLLAYSAYARKQTGARYLLTLLFAALGLLSKSMLVTIPFVLLLLDFWPLARFSKKQIARLLLEKIPFALLAAGSAVGTLLAQHGTINTRGFSFLLRIENAIVACTIYLRQLFWPTKLAVLYPFPEKYFPVSTITGSLLLLGVISVFARRLALVPRHARSGSRPCASWPAKLRRSLHLSAAHRNRDRDRLAVGGNWQRSARDDNLLCRRGRDRLHIVSGLRASPDFLLAESGHTLAAHACSHDK